ncbi:uncharacterized protein CANTADRAFT_24263 [Suhomyces tanzawaensis NRRL Y-17324]|uniref:Uncharacterized protein n=1 Tax=Suhomyces tanzawaensis NRRL Y-17324 TaxID=984487 RepID=A0A1E4SB36_9ASCO|nr:uncharacterized protein CANTADRAFT_24263 [Suhomyces tanzawaensis NRRL Y-17324]ODV76688.1 hypothetical protein CANTADRAFT_24263 [Suhomyces tanzawaensis NRRL Y-17324]
MDIINRYLGEVSSVSRLNQKDQVAQLSRLLSLDPQVNQYVLVLNSIPSEVSLKQINIENYNVYNNEWLAFNELLLSFINFALELNPWSALESYDLYTTYLNDLSIAFNNNNRGHLLSYLVKESIQTIIPLSIKLDAQFFIKEFRSRPRLTYLASVLLKIFNNIRSQINDTNQLKKTIILFVSNKLCLIYFKLENPLLCRNIFSNMNNANLSMRTFSKLEQVQYRYYLSKFYLIKDQLIESFGHIQWCLLNCPLGGSSQERSNLEKILKIWLPVCLVIGKVPNFNYIHQISGPSPIVQMYSKLSHHMGVGNFQGFNTVLLENYTYLKENNLLLLLANKSKVLILRNLVKKVWKLMGCPTNLDFDIIKSALALSLGSTSYDKSTFPFLQSPHDIDDYLVENIFISLIDQNLLKGKIFLVLRKVALSKMNAFARVGDINFTRFSRNSKADAWMNQ